MLAIRQCPGSSVRSKIATRVSCHSRWPSSTGELQAGEGVLEGRRLVDPLGQEIPDLLFLGQGLVQDRIRHSTYRAMASALGWPARTTVEQSLEGARRYLRNDLRGEAVLTLANCTRHLKPGQIS